MKNLVPFAAMIIFIVAVAFGLFMGAILLFAELAASLGPDGLSLLAVIGLIIGVVVAALMVVRSITDMRYSRQLQRLEVERQEQRVKLVSADASGLLPVNVDMLQLPAVIGQQMQQYLEHQTSRALPGARTPQTLTFAPHYSNRNDTNVQGSEVAQLPVAQDVPTFWRLVEESRLPKDRLLLGFNIEDNQPIESTWSNLYSSLVGGVSGSGKSTLMRNILAQSALQGAQFMVIDPHLNSGEESLGQSLLPLRPLMIADIACEDSEIVQTLQYFLDIAKARLDGKDKNREPLILVVDEVTALLQRGKQRELLAEALEMISTETRKISVYAMCGGQNFHGKIIDTTIRDNFASSIGCKMKKSVGRTMTQDNEFAQAVAKLNVGQAVWLPSMGEMITMNIPNCTENDIFMVAQRKLLSTSGSPSFKPASNQRQNDEIQLQNDTEWRVSDASLKLERSTNEASLMLESERILTMFHNGVDVTEITKGVYDFDKAGGARYQEKLAHVNAVIRERITK